MLLETKNLIVNKKRGLIKKALFSNILKIKNEVLGHDYELAVNFIPPTEAQNLNITYRRKDYIPNILSFPLAKKEGEIFICLSVVRAEAKKFSLTYDNFLILLLVHGALHLRGLEHGLKMEKLEQTISEKYMLKCGNE